VREGRTRKPPLAGAWAAVATTAAQGGSTRWLWSCPNPMGGGDLRRVERGW
jgi:hypothetical protein